MLDLVRLEEVVPLTRVVIVSEDPFRFNVELLPVEAVLPLFLWSAITGGTLLFPLTVIALLVGGNARGSSATSEAPSLLMDAVPESSLSAAVCRTDETGTFFSFTP